MSIEMLLDFLAWCTLVNWVILLVWFGIFTLAHDWVYRFHHLYFELSEQQFDASHYTAMAGFKVLIIVFNLVPYLVLRMLV